MRADRKHPLWYAITIAVALWVAILLMVVGSAHAQGGGEVFSARESGQPHGHYQICWNTTGTQIDAGTLVMADTTATGTVPQIAMGKGIKTWSGATGDFGKIIGILIGDAIGFGQCRVLTKGFVPNAKLMSGVAAGSYLRPSLTAAGRMASWAATSSADSLNQLKRKQCGIFQRYARPDSAIGYVWVDFPPR